MEYRVLGPIEVRVDGRPVAVGGPKPRALLALLLLNAGRVVPTSEVIEALWGGHPPASGATRVHGVVSELRAALGCAGMAPGPLGTRPHGYLLTPADGELDLDVFERRLAEARAAAAQGQLAAAAAAHRGALGLWRGPALAGVAAPFAGAEAARLEERRLVVLEELAEVELALGRHAALVSELVALVGRHPLRERLRERLMLALYRSGRHAEALEVYRDGHRLLVEKLGLEPGPDLQKLQRAILAGDPGLLEAGAPAEPVAAPPAQLPPDVADFTGRDEQVARLCGALDPGRPATAMAVAVVSGKPGVGKSALAVHVAHRLRPGFPGGQLHVDLGGTEHRPLAPEDVLDRFLRGLGVGGAAVPAAPEERRDLYRSRLADRRVLVVLDNAADEAQVRPLLPGSPSCAVVVTSRARLAGLDGALRLDLDVLGAGQATELLARIAGQERVAAEPGAAEEIVALCGQLPLAVRVAGARLAVRGHWRLADLAALLADERHRLDELAIADIEVRAGLALSYQGLDGEARRLFRRLGLLAAPTVAAWVTAALLDPSTRRCRAPPGRPGRRAPGRGARDRRHRAGALPVPRPGAAVRPRTRRRRGAGGRAACGRGARARRLARPGRGRRPGAGRGQRPDHPQPGAALARRAGAVRAAGRQAGGLVRERARQPARRRRPGQRGRAGRAGVGSGRLLGLVLPDGLLPGLAGGARARRRRGAGGRRYPRAGRAAGGAGLGAVRADPARRARPGVRAGQRVVPAPRRPSRRRRGAARRGKLPAADQPAGAGPGPVPAGACPGGADGRARPGSRRRLRHRHGRPRAGPARPGAGRAGADPAGLAGPGRQPLGRADGPAARAGAPRPGDLAAAEAHLQRALALADELGDRQQRLLLLVDRAELRSRLGDRDAARDGLQDALRHARDLGLLYDQARSLYALGDLHAAEGKLDEAIGCLTESVRLWRLVGIPRRLAAALVRLGSVLDEAGAPAPAAEARDEARRLLSAMEAAAAEAVGRLDRLTET